MKAIYASKMYKYNKNKAKIQAALDNPINKELVIQLKEYLDEPEVSEPVAPVKPDTKRSDTVESEPEAPTPSNRSIPMSAPSAHNRVGKLDLDTAFNEGDHKEDDPDSLLDTEFEDSNSGDSSNEDTKSDTVEEATTVVGKVIQSASCITCNNMADVISEIKGLLNLRQDTAGVNRVLHKDNELWLYYNDSVNLNNVMGAVIELLNASGYTYLDFNRLARTDNAIVFQVSILDSDNIIEPVRGVDNGK